MTKRMTTGMIQPQDTDRTFFEIGVSHSTICLWYTVRKAMRRTMTMTMM